MDWDHENSEKRLTRSKRDYDAIKDGLYRPTAQLCSNQLRERTQSNIFEKNNYYFLLQGWY